MLYLVSAMLTYGQGWIMSNVAMNITYRFRKDIAEKINRMPLRYFDGTNHGEVLSRITNDVDTVSQTLNQSLTQIITSVAMVVGVLVMMFTISWQMTLVALAILPLSFGIVGLIVSRSQVFFKQQQDYLGHINGQVEEMYGGHIVMKAFNGEAKSVEQFDQINWTLYNSAWKSQFPDWPAVPDHEFRRNLGYVAICIWAATWPSWAPSPSAISRLLSNMFARLRSRSRRSPNISNILQQTMAAAERVFQFLAEPEEIPGHHDSCSMCHR